MNRTERTTGWRAGVPDTLLPAVAVVVLTLGLLAVAPGRPPAGTSRAGTWTNDRSWTNDVLTERLGEFPPAVEVSPSNDSQEHGILANPFSLAEVRLSGVVLSTTPLPQLDWTTNNLSTPDRSLVEFQKFVNTSGQGPPVVFINLSARAGGASGSPAATLVESVTVLDDQLAHNTDFLELAFPVTPIDPFVEKLSSGPTDTLDCVDRSSDDPREFFSWSAQATVWSNGTPTAVNVSAAVGSNAMGDEVDVLVPGAPQAYQAVDYQVQLGIVLPPPRSVASSTDTILVALAAAAVAGGLLILARWSGGSPPTLGRAPR
jgi:hypothetical protein